MIAGFVALAALMVGLLRDVKGDVRDVRNDKPGDQQDFGRRFDNLRAETRDAILQIGQRVDDLRATVLATVPRAAAEPAGEAWQSAAIDDVVRKTR